MAQKILIAALLLMVVIMIEEFCKEVGQIITDMIRDGKRRHR